MRLAAVAGLAISLFLTWAALRNGPVPGCGVDSSFTCGSVFLTRWAKWFGLPVSALAAGVYVAVLVMLAKVSPRCWRQDPDRALRAFGALTALALMLLGAAVWFVVLMWSRGEFCRYCLAAHACGLVVSLLVFAAVMRRRAALATLPPETLDAIPGAGRSRLVYMGFLGLAMLVVGQRVYTSPEVRITRFPGRPDTDTGPGPDREMTFLSRRVGPLRTHDYPILGSPDAKYVAVSLYDYTCPHCRAQHRNLRTALDRYGDEFAVILLFVPLETKCNRFVSRTTTSAVGSCYRAEAAMALWRARPDLYAAFDAWMYEVEEVRSDGDVRKYIVDRMGEQEYVKARADPWIDRQIGRNTALFMNMTELSGIPTVPKLLAGTSIIEGQGRGPKELFEEMEAALGVKSAAPAAGAAAAPSPAVGDTPPAAPD